MLRYFHRFVVRGYKNKNNYYEKYLVEEFVATENIEPFNFKKKIRFKEIDDIPDSFIGENLKLNRVKSKRIRKIEKPDDPDDEPFPF